MSQVRHIHILPPDLANQIAAGEVVERPASVVKELVENALDAGARRVSVDIELGGKARIRVEDDGEGMTPEDARVAVERHATSKIASASDLEAIATLGFRGEALPSVASVSRFCLRTRARGAPFGYEVRIEAGQRTTVGQIGAPEGTFVEVADLFFNLPARRKFLKADAAESAQVSRLVTQLALAYPEVGFALTSGGRRVIECSPVTALRERLYQIYRDRRNLVEVKREGGGIRIEGYAAPLAEQGPVRGPQNIYVNRRIVRDKTLHHAIVQAYSAATIKERSPEVHLFLTMDPRRVDVNVHPTKAEVRFLDQGLVHEVLRRALTDALGAGPMPELRLRPTAGAQEASAPLLPGVLTLGASVSPGLGPRSLDDSVAVPPVRAAGVSSPEREVSSAEGDWGSELGMAVGRLVPERRTAGIDAVQPMIPLGQFRDTFIVAVDSEGLSIIDQHVAHERVLYEQILGRLSAGGLESQRLLTPIVLELAAGEREVLLSHQSDLAPLGFEIEEFGGDTLKVSAMPALLKVHEAASAMRVLATDLEGLDRGARVHDALGRIAATMACHAAVKASDRLTIEQMQYILDELRRTSYSTVCPHGRPVALRLSRREMERNFQRI
ncbi:MAG: DNA mismatch repair endonuclease MutL [Luteitalea sp.]|nr:DNA mismatch repair endonuclease MutL [Luteitalea sp.]